jgi:hypothetical protein
MHVLLVLLSCHVKQSNMIFIFEVLVLLPQCFLMIEMVLFHHDLNQQ